jgi:predicted RNase H-like HicB family nuclease
MNYTVIFEKTNTGYSAYVPDLPGCITTGGTRDETERNMREAMRGHLELMREEGLPIPEPTTTAELIPA